VEITSDTPRTIRHHAMAVSGLDWAVDIPEGVDPEVYATCYFLGIYMAAVPTSLLPAAPEGRRFAYELWCSLFSSEADRGRAGLPEHVEPYAAGTAAVLARAVRPE
jgi:hypothetical protein